MRPRLPGCSLTNWQRSPARLHACIACAPKVIGKAAKSGRALISWWSQRTKDRCRELSRLKCREVSLATCTRGKEVPSFAPGEEAYVFLWISPDGSFRILGWSQGSFRIRKDSSTGLETVTQDSASAPIFDPVSRQFRHGGVRKLPVAAFEVKVKRAMTTH